MALSLGQGLHFAITASDKTAAAFKQVQGNLSGTEQLLTGVKVALGAAFGAGALLAIGRMIDRTLDLQDQIGKLSTRLGVSTEALSELRHVGELAGLQFETLTMGLQRMQRRIAEAANGSGEARGALVELGLSARELTRLPLDRQFEAIAEALSGVEESGDRTRLAMKLFDSEGVALLQTMQNGAAGIRQYREEARQLGRSLSEDQVRAAEAAKDAMTRLDAAGEGLAIRVTNLVVPAFTRLVEVLRDELPPAAQGVQEELTGLSGFGLETLLENLRAFTDFVPEFLLPDGWTEQMEMFERAIDEAKIGLDAFGGTVASWERQASGAANATRNLGRAIEDMSDSLAVPPRPRRKPDGTAIGRDDLDAHLDAFRRRRSQLEGEAEAVRRAIETPIEAYNRQIEKLRELRDAGVISHAEMARAALHYEKEMIRATDQTDKLAESLADDVAGGIESVGRMLLRQGNDWRDWAGLAIDMIGDVVSSMGGLAGLFGAGKPGANMASALPGGGSIFDFLTGGGIGGLGSLLGFAQGGEFKVGGSGGTDSQVVAFRASPDETVSITRPGQGRRGTSVQVAIHVDARGASDPKAVEEAGRRGALAAAPQIIQAATDAVAERHRREPRYLDPSRRG